MRAFFLFIFVLGRMGFSATYWVDITNGNNSNAGTSLVEAWQTVSNAARITQAGDTVVVQPGFYSRDIVTLSSNGAADAPITYTATNGDAWLYRLTLNGSWHVLSGFSFQSNGSIDAGTYICTIKGMSNLVTDLRFPISAADNRMLSLSGTNNTVRSCYLAHPGYEASFMSGRNNLIESNFYADAVSVDYLLLFGISNTVRSCIFSNLDYTGGLHSDCIQSFVSSGSHSQFHTIERCLEINCPGGQFMNVSDDGGTNNVHSWVIRNNLIVNSWGTCNIGFTNAQFYNNTFYKAEAGNPIYLKNDGSVGGAWHGSNATMFNNLFLDCGTNLPTSGVPTTSSGTIAGYNLCCGPNGESKNLIFGINNITNGATTAATFVNAAGGDWRLKTGSLAIGAGTNLYSLFTTDFTGASRPAVGSWSIGVYEGGINTLPRTININTLRVGRIASP